jgi:hypothetical protein
MSGIDTNLAVAALAIALVAFITALGQLLQQYFATADGYRRCQRSVMGGWAAKTKLRWRWREFRFETLYTTPNICLLYEYYDEHTRMSILGSATGATRAAPISGSRQSMTDTMLSSRSTPRSSGRNHEMVCWVLLLHHIHESTMSYSGVPAYRPAVTFEERSWDFQVPDIVRPLATITVCDIAIIARRMGMQWKDFRPVDGILRAEGGGHIITSTLVRSLGLLVQYNYTRPPTPLWLTVPERYIPVSDSDALGFGIITGVGSILGQDPPIGTTQEFINTLSILDLSGWCAVRMKEVARVDPGYSIPLADLVSMIMEMSRLRGTNLVHVPAPSNNMNGFSVSHYGRRAFCKCLEDYVSNKRYRHGPQTEAVLQATRQLINNQPEWGEREFGLENQYSTDYLDLVHDHFDQTTRWYRTISDFQKIHRILISAYLRFCVFHQTRPHLLVAENPDYEAEMKRYFDLWPLILNDTKAQLFHTEELYFDSWVTILFRACCWGACHIFLPGERVPSEFWHSQLPVYIG